MSGGQSEVGGTLPGGGGGGGGGGKGRGMAVGKPKNKAASNLQITAEQLLLEARDRTEQEPHKTRSKLHDKEELMEYRSNRRRDYENMCQRNKMLVGNWTKYAKWEEKQGEYTRARSIFGRALDIHPSNQSLYQRYAEMEMQAENINQARNVWHRAVTQLPRVDALWLKWVHLEETIGDVAMCRQVFRNWMEWKPKQNMWHLFAKFEIRFKEIQNARDVIAQMVTLFNDVDAWCYYARFEEKYGKIALARQCYEQAIDALGDECEQIDRVFVNFARFEERQKELERARMIYKIALDRIPKHKAPELYETYTNFEKQYGEREGIEEALLSRRRFEYEENVKGVDENYDIWFNYIRMEESQGDVALTREVYERSVAATPSIAQKQYWARYIYLWLMYAQFEEVDVGDVARTRQVFQAALKAVPHKSFSFSKLWIAYAEFELRQSGIEAARQVMGKGLGVHPRPKMYRWYIALERSLGNIERVQNLYTSWLKKTPSSGETWAKFAELEVGLQEYARARHIFNIAINQPVLEQPELLWKRFIAMEVKLGNYEAARTLYRNLANKTKHIQVYLAWADMEASQAKDPEQARAVYEDAETELSAEEEWKQEWTALVEAWKVFEEHHGSAETVAKVDLKLHPEKAKGRQSKMLEKAMAWKRRRLQEKGVCK